ncbi:CID domain-containing protein [Entamoeba marina]
MNNDKPVLVPNDELALYNFKKTLANIENDQGIIHSLAQLAVVNVNHADLYVELVNEQFSKCRSVERKLYILYVIDMIVKSDRLRVYINYFNQNIAGMFIQVYQQTSESIRVALWQLYSTWKEVFPESTLNQIRSALTTMTQTMLPKPQVQTQIPSHQRKSSHSSQSTTPSVIPINYSQPTNISINANTQNTSTGGYINTVHRYEQPKSYPSAQQQVYSYQNSFYNNNDNASLPPSTDPQFQQNIPIEIMNDYAEQIPVEISMQQDIPSNQPLMSPATNINTTYSRTTSVSEQQPYYQDTYSQQQGEVPVFPIDPSGRSGVICELCGCRYVDMTRHLRQHELINASSGINKKQWYSTANDWRKDEFGIEENYGQNVMEQEISCSICGKPIEFTSNDVGELFLQDGVVDDAGNYYHSTCFQSSAY